jgi:hypothetical protein
MGRREFVPREMPCGIEIIRQGRRSEFQTSQSEVFRAASRLGSKSDGDTAASFKEEQQETGADQRQRDRDEQRQEFLTGLGSAGEEGHMQLRFLSEVSSGLVGF